MATNNVVWEAIRAVYRAAEETGALRRTNTRPETLRDRSTGLSFQLQVSEALKDKPKAKSKRGDEKPGDVFATRDVELSVDEEFSETHQLRLNKFNVVPFHTLVITREFEPQTAPLTEADWESTLRAMQAYPEGAIAYFNGGEASGSSQPRKHTQIIPLSRGGSPTAPLPFQALAQQAKVAEGHQPLEAFQLRDVPFQIFAAALPENVTSAHLQTANNNLRGELSGSVAEADYNVLATKDWMLLIPRKQDACGPVGCNALVFAGTFLVRSVMELDYIKEQGPLAILQAVTFPWDS